MVASGGLECVSVVKMDYSGFYIKYQDKLQKVLKKKFGETTALLILEGHIDHFCAERNEFYQEKLKEKEDQINLLQIEIKSSEEKLRTKEEQLKLLQIEIKTSEEKLTSKENELRETLNKLHVCRRSIRLKPKQYPAPKPPSSPPTGDEMTSREAPAPSGKQPHFCGVASTQVATSNCSPRMAQGNKLPWNNAELRRLQLNDARWHTIIRDMEKNPKSKRLQNYRLYNGVLFWCHSIHSNTRIKLCVPESVTITIIKMIEKTLHNISVNMLFEKTAKFFMFRNMRKYITQYLN